MPDMFTLAGQAVTWLEVVAFLTGLVSVWLTWRMHVASWPVGLVNVACFSVLFVQAKLYADALLQVAFFGLGVYGWLQWARAGRQPSGLRPAHAPWREVVGMGAAGVAGTAAAAWVLLRFTDSPAPWPDAAILAFSLVATWAQARRYVLSWPIWIAVDVVSIPLYWSRALPLTAVLYLLFLAICVAGWRHWLRLLRTGQAA